MPPKPSAKPPAKPAHTSVKRLQKATAKQPLPTSDRLKRLFTSLCAQIDGGHFANAIKTCDKILRIEPKDPDALQTKLFLLLQTDQYAAALAMTEAPSGLPSSDGENEEDVRAFEQAYSLYRIHREVEATRILDRVKEKNGGADEEVNRGVLHLEAQLAYRQGSYQAAFDLYNQLLDTAEPNSEEHSDILINLEAAQKHLDFLTLGFLHALDALPSSVPGALQTAPPPQQQQQQAATVSALAASSVAPVADAQNPKKVRMKRVPKGVVPGVSPAPDPERWLKKSERTSFTQSNRRRKGGGGATQGAMESPIAPAKSAGGGKGKKKK